MKKSVQETHPILYGSSHMLSSRNANRLLVTVTKHPKLFVVKIRMLSHVMCSLSKLLLKNS